MRFSTSAARMVPTASVIWLALVAAGCSPTTYGTGEAPEMAIFGEVTGNITGRSGKQPIDYKPRAPLVVPPQNQLRAPVQTAAATTPNWPQDPDQRVRGDRAADPGRPGAVDDMSPEYVARLKPLAELNRDRPRVDEPRAGSENAPRELIVNRNQRTTFQAAVADAEGTSTTERRFLTDPPQEYRQPSATAQQEFQDIQPKKQGFFSRLFN